MNASGDSERDRRIYDRGAQRNIWFDFAANDGTEWQIDRILHASKGQKGRMSDGRGKKYLLVSKCTHGESFQVTRLARELRRNRSQQRRNRLGQLNGGARVEQCTVIVARASLGVEGSGWRTPDRY